MIRALIVENEPAVAQLLVEKIKRNFADIEIVGVFDTVSTSLAAINLYHPQLVFLDVELHGTETGFDILEKLISIDFKVIFTTAHNKYAIQAIKFSALDYLLKPIDEEELKFAIRKFIIDRGVTSISQKESLLAYTQDHQNVPIGLPSLEGITFIPVGEIAYCKGESSQTSVHTTNKKEKIVNRTLKECEEMLEKFGFCRIHKSYVVNLHHVRKYNRGDGGFVDLSEGSKLDVSKNYKDELLGRLHKL